MKNLKRTALAALLSLLAVIGLAVPSQAAGRMTESLNVTGADSRSVNVTIKYDADFDLVNVNPQPYGTYKITNLGATYSTNTPMLANAVRIYIETDARYSNTYELIFDNWGVGGSTTSVDDVSSNFTFPSHAASGPIVLSGQTHWKMCVWGVGEGAIQNGPFCDTGLLTS